MKKNKNFKYLIEEKLGRKLKDFEKTGLIFGNSLIPLLEYNEKSGKYKVILRDIHYKFINEWKDDLEEIRDRNLNPEKYSYGWKYDLIPYSTKLIYVYDILYFANNNLRIDSEEKLKEIIENYEDLELFIENFGYQLI